MSKEKSYLFTYFMTKKVEFCSPEKYVEVNWQISVRLFPKSVHVYSFSLLRWNIRKNSKINISSALLLKCLSARKIFHNIRPYIKVSNEIDIYMHIGIRFCPLWGGIWIHQISVQEKGGGNSIDKCHGKNAEYRWIDFTYRILSEVLSWMDALTL